MKVKRYDECVTLSEEALSDLTKFHSNNDIWFQRRIALSKGYLGDKDQAIKELIQILLRKKDWFIQNEIASFFFDLNKNDDAFKYAVDAALNYGEVKFKCELFFLMGKVLQAQQRNEEAKKHILLSYKLRSENTWKIPQELQDKIRELQVDVNNNISAERLYQELKREWQSIKKTDSPEMPKLHGKIKTIVTGSTAGFIMGENNKDYYFKFRDCHLKESDIKTGLLVEFGVEKSYDKKKDRESERAVGINILQN